MLVAPLVEQRVAFEAQPVLEGTGRIVDARMDDAAVVRAILQPQCPMTLDDRDLLRLRELDRHSEAYDAATDDRCADVHAQSAFRRLPEDRLEPELGERRRINRADYLGFVPDCRIDEGTHVALV